MTSGFTRSLKDEAATEQFGADIAMALRAGDVVLLRGDLGAGKTTLARGLIRKLAGDPLFEVPSPTYTLCQSYDLTPPLAHYDLYRIAGVEELDELGISEAMETSAVLVEWPERAGADAFGAAATIELTGEGDGRNATISGQGATGEALASRIARSLAIRDFLDESWGANCQRRFLQGDASVRRYETVSRDGEIRVLMDSPRQPDGPPIRDGKPYSRIAHLAEDVVPFIGIDELLRQHGFAAPMLHASSIGNGLILMEHLGSEAIVDGQGKPVASRYCEAARLLARLHQIDWPDRVAGKDTDGRPYEHTIPAYDLEAMLIEVSLLIDWYVPAYGEQTLSDADRQVYFDLWMNLAGIINKTQPTLVMRDYHSPNLIWREDESFPANLGLLDFQDALIGPAAYDLASLAQDARVDIGSELEQKIVAAYIEERQLLPKNFDGNAFSAEYAIMGAQRASKILGIFVRLDRRDGKPGYLRHLPRMRDYLSRNLAHPALAEIKQWCAGPGGVILEESDS